MYVHGCYKTGWHKWQVFMGDNTYDNVCISVDISETFLQAIQAAYTAFYHKLSAFILTTLQPKNKKI